MCTASPPLRLNARRLKNGSSASGFSKCPAPGDIVRDTRLNDCWRTTGETITAFGRTLAFAFPARPFFVRLACTAGLFPPAPTSALIEIAASTVRTGNDFTFLLHHGAPAPLLHPARETACSPASSRR